MHWELDFWRSPSSRLTAAATFLISARPWITSSGMRSPEMRKKRRLRSVCAPHRRAAGTSIGPNESRSVRVPLIAAPSLLLEQAPQHPRVLFVDIHALCQEIERRLVVRFLGDGQHLARGLHHRFLRLY